MGRKKNIIAPEAQPMDLAVQDHRDRQIMAVKVFEAFGIDGKNYDILTYTQIAKNVFQLHEMTALAGGQVLQVIKTQETHGVFLKTLEQIGIHPRKAQRYMNLARKFGKYDNLSYLQANKLQLLEELSDPQLEEIDAGGDFLGLTLDTIDRMPASDLRERVRKLEAKAADDKIRHTNDVKEMSAELEVLRLRDKGLAPPTKEQLAQVQLDELRKKFLMPINLLAEYYRGAIAILDEAQQIEGITIPQLEGFVDHFGEEITILEGLRVDYDETIENIRPQQGAGTEG
jgi:hypothetical protein